MLNAYPHRTTRPDSQEHIIRIEGAGDSDPDKLLGAGVSVERTGTGAYKIVWDDNPGVFLGAYAGLQASTVADLAGYTVVFGDYDSDDLELPLTVTDETDSPADLTADEFLMISAVFSTSAVGGA